MFQGTVAIIGAREGSKRLPGKNIKLLGNYPLIAYSIFVARASYFIDNTIVSTDSQKIAEIAFEYEAKILIRPKELASDTSTDLDWIMHFLKEYKKKHGIYPKKLVFLRPTTVFRQVSIVDSIISLFDDRNDSLRSLEEIPEAVEKHFKLDGNNLIKPICKCIKLKDTNNANQTFAKSYKGNGYCDILKPEYILDTKSLYGNSIQGFITPKSIEIDTLEDFEYANYKIRKIYDNKNN